MSAYYPNSYTEKKKLDFEEIKDIAKSLPNYISVGVTDDNENLAFIEVEGNQISSELRAISLKFNSPYSGHSISLIFVTEGFEEGKRYAL